MTLKLSDIEITAKLPELMRSMPVYKVNSASLNERQPAIELFQDILHLGKAVPEGLVRQVIEAATLAPSAKNGQQWRFTVLTGDVKKGLTDLFRHELELLNKKIGEENSP